ncbi:MAG: TetR/AcrR family transcriptional regulator [Deltaproteobacteria bacterium]|nr:TetR/AcrR family transcriptional regulator [Deltaproteobacteria bacterium]
MTAANHSAPVPGPWRRTLFNSTLAGSWSGVCFITATYRLARSAQLHGKAPKTTRVARDALQQQRAHDTIDTIREAARRIIAQDGFAAATAHQIARVAGVGIGTLYRYYPDRRAVLGELLDALFDALHAKLIGAREAHANASLEQIATQIVEGYVAMLREQREVLAPLLAKRPMIETVERRAARQRQLQTWLREQLDAHAQLVIDHDFAAFVLLKAVDAVTTSTLTQRPQALESGELQRELSRVVVSYLRAARQAEVMKTNSLLGV